MDFSLLFSQLLSHLNAVSITLFILLVGSEVMGTNPNIKTSSWYSLVQSVLATIKDQVWPKPVVVPASTPVVPTDVVKA